MKLVAGPGKPIDITDDQFPHFVSDHDLVIIDLWAPWCGPCKRIAPLLEEITREDPRVVVGKINTDENPRIAMKYGVMSIPTMLFFKGGQLVDQVVGAVPKTEILRRVEPHLSA